jgi:hypothetical protein
MSLLHRYSTAKPGVILINPKSTILKLSVIESVGIESRAMMIERTRGLMLIKVRGTKVNIM